MFRKRAKSFSSLFAVVSTIFGTSLCVRAAPLSDKIFLTPADLPGGFKMTEAHLDGLSDSPPAFAACHGQDSGLKVFQAGESAPLQRVVDIRWTFPNAADAEKFFQLSSQTLSEGAPVIPDAKAVGEDCKAYGGENTLGMDLGAGSFYNYYYIFRSGRVVAKIYGSEGAMAKSHPTLEMLLPFAQTAANKCKSF